MVIALVIVSILLAAAVAFIFFLLKVLKNTYCILDKAQEIIKMLDNLRHEKAYDGKYYPATLILSIKYECEEDMLITDFSRYDSHKVVGFTLLNKCSYPEEEYESLGVSREDVEEPQIIPNVIVYSPREGIWKWKYPD